MNYPHFAQYPMYVSSDALKYRRTTVDYQIEVLITGKKAIQEQSESNPKTINYIVQKMELKYVEVWLTMWTKQMSDTSDRHL